MGKKIFQIAFVIFVLLAFAKAINEYLSKLISDPSAFEFYIKSFPSGNLSRVSTLSFNMAKDFDAYDYPINEAINQELVHFTPRIKGTFYWTDKRTLEFLPSEPLPSGTTYYYRVNFNKIFSSQQRLKVFRNKFWTPEIQFQLLVNNLQYIDSIHLKTEGSITFNDQIDFKTVHQVVNAKQGNHKLPIRIMQSNQLLSYNFIIDSIKRKAHVDTLKIEWQRKLEVEADNKEIETKLIPPVHSFEILSSKIIYENQMYLKIEFSNPIKSIDSIKILGALIERKEQKANYCNFYFVDSIPLEQFAINIPSSMKDIYDNKLTKAYYKKQSVDNREPLLSSAHKNTLSALPINQLKLNIKAKNLNKVYIQVYEIPTQNVLQYLQSTPNNLAEIMRVGKLISEKEVNLAIYPSFSPENLANYSIDFSNLAPKNGSIIHYFVRYNYNCIHFKPKKAENLKEQSIVQDIIYTNIDAIAKITPTDTLELHVFDNQIGTTIRNAKVEVYDFQQHLLSESQTNKKGISLIRINKHVAFIKVTFEEHAFYLRLFNITDGQPIKDNDNFSYLNPFFFSNKTTYQSGDSIVSVIMLNPQVNLNSYPLKFKYAFKDANGKILHSEIKSYNKNSIVVIRHKTNKSLSSGKYFITTTLLDKEESYPIYVKNHTVNNCYCTSDFIDTYNDSLPLLDWSNNSDSSITTTNTNKINSLYGLKENYFTNDTLKISLKKGIYERVFVSIENTTRTFATAWFSLKNNELHFSKKLDSQFWPGAFLNIIAFDKLGNEYSFLHPFKVINASKKIQPKIIAPFDFEWNKNTNIRIKEENGEAIEYVVKISENKEHNKVKKYNPFTFYDSLKEPKIHTYYSFKLQNQDFKKEESYNPLLSESNNDYNEKCLILGPFSLDANNINDHTIKAPLAIGKAKIEILCRSKNDSKFGYSFKNISISKNILAEFSYPQYLQPNEEIKVTGNLFINNTLSDYSSIELFNPINCAFIDQSRYKIKLDQKQKNYPFTFSIKTNNITGKATFDVIISDSNQIYEETIQIPIISLNPSFIQSKHNSIDPKQQWQTNILPKGIKGTNKSVLEVSQQPLTLFNYSLQKLNQKNYTDIRSKIIQCLPLLKLHLITDLEPAEKNSINKQIEQCLKSTLTHIKADGKFYVNGLSEQENIQFNLMAGQFIVEAKNAGFNINTRLLNQYIRKLEFDIQFADFTTPQEYKNIAQKLYLLSRAQTPNIEAMNKLNEQNDLNIKNRLYLALCFTNERKTKASKINYQYIINNAAYSINELNLDELAINLLINQNLKIIDTTFSIEKRIHSLIINDKYLNDYQLSHSVYLLSKWLIANNLKTNTNLGYRINKGKTNAINNRSPLQFINIPIEFTIPKSLDLINENNTKIHANISTIGIPLKPQIIKTQLPISLSINYYDSSGNDMLNEDIKLNQCFNAEIIIENNGKESYRNFILTYPYASGWELIKTEETLFTAKKLSNISSELNFLNYALHLKAFEKIHIPIYFESKYEGNFYLAPLRLIDGLTNETIIQLKGKYSTTNQSITNNF